MSDYFVVRNVVSLYAKPQSSSEVVSQAVSGARVHVDAEQDEFCHVATSDQYQGWIAASHLTPVWDDTDYFQTSIATLFAEVYSAPDPQSEMLTKLVVGTRVAIDHRPEVDDWVPLLLPDRQTGYVHKVCLNSSHSEPNSGVDFLDQRARRAIDVPALKRQVLAAVGRQAVRIAGRLIGTPYLWGGCTPFGIDCSGLVQLAYKLSGVQLLRDADLQFHDRRFYAVEEGTALAEASFEAGDLLVFSSREDRKATHIGLARSDGRFIHAAGGRGVVRDACDSPFYSNIYTGAVRISPDADLAVEAA